MVLLPMTATIIYTDQLDTYGLASSQVLYYNQVHTYVYSRYIGKPSSVGIDKDWVLLWDTEGKVRLRSLRMHLFCKVPS